MTSNVTLDEARELMKDKSWSVSVFDNVPALKFQFVFYKQENDRYFGKVLDIPYYSLNSITKKTRAEFDSLQEKVTELNLKRIKIIEQTFLANGKH